MADLSNLPPQKCAKCGHEGPPNVRQPGGVRADMTERLPRIGELISAARVVAAVPHCAGCGEQLTGSIVDIGKERAKGAVTSIGGLFARKEKPLAIPFKRKSGTIMIDIGEGEAREVECRVYDIPKKPNKQVVLAPLTPDQVYALPPDEAMLGRRVWLKASPPATADFEILEWKPLGGTFVAIVSPSKADESNE